MLFLEKNYILILRGYIYIYVFFFSSNEHVRSIFSPPNNLHMAQRLSNCVAHKNNTLRNESRQKISRYYCQYLSLSNTFSFWQAITEP